MKKDKIFIIVLAIIIANFAYQIAAVIIVLFANPLTYGLWFLLVADIVGLLGLFWLFRSYKQSRKLAKEEELRSKNEIHN